MKARGRRAAVSDRQVKRKPDAVHIVAGGLLACRENADKGRTWNELSNELRFAPQGREYATGPAQEKCKDEYDYADQPLVVI